MGHSADYKWGCVYAIKPVHILLTQWIREPPPPQKETCTLNSCFLKSLNMYDVQSFNPGKRIVQRKYQTFYPFGSSLDFVFI